MGEDHAAIMKLQVQATALQRKTEAETQRLNELDALRRQVERKIREQRSDKTRVRSGGVYASKTTTLRTTKIHGQLETRRAGLNRKAAAFDLENASVRAAVNARRRKMGLFDKVYERLTKELRQVDRDKQALMNVSNESYMQHEDAKRQTARLETINAREQEDCDRLCREAEAMIARQNEAREFVDSVTKKRLEAEKAAENAEAIAQLEGDSGGGGGGEAKEQPEESQEHVLKARLRDLKRGAAAQEAHIRAVDMQLLSAEQAFTRLRKVSGLQSTAAVVAAFVANEDENFSLFNFIQQTNDESSRQAEAVEKLEKEMARFKREKEAKSEHAYTVINSLKSKRTNAEDRIYQLKSRLAEARLELLQLCTGVSQMFSHIGCSWEHDDGAGGGGGDGANPNGGDGGDGGGGNGIGGVVGNPPGTAGTVGSGTSSTAGGAGMEIPEGGAKPNNILMYIGMIEQRATEIIQEFVRLQNQKSFGASGGMMDETGDSRFTFVNPFGPPHPHDDSLSASTHMKHVKRPTLAEAQADLHHAAMEQKGGGGEGGGGMLRPLSRFELTSRVMQSMDNGRAGSVSLPSLR